MKHFIVDIQYLVPVEQLKDITPEHRAFLKMGYEQGKILFSGPKVPPTGGMVIARSETAEELVEFFHHDPYQMKGVATHHFIEFNPVLKQGWMGDWVSGK